MHSMVNVITRVLVFDIIDEASVSLELDLLRYNRINGGSVSILSALCCKKNTQILHISVSLHPPPKKSVC